MFTISVIRNGQKLNLVRRHVLLNGQWDTLFTFEEGDHNHVINDGQLNFVLPPLYQDETVTSVIVERKMSQ